MPLAISFVANIAFTPIQFGLRNQAFAAVDSPGGWTTMIWITIVIWPHYRREAVAQVPSFVWVSMATVIQLSMIW